MLREISWAQKDKSYMILHVQLKKKTSKIQTQIINSTAVTIGWVRGRKQETDGKYVGQE